MKLCSACAAETCWPLATFAFLESRVFSYCDLREAYGTSAGVYTPLSLRFRAAAQESSPLYVSMPSLMMPMAMPRSRRCHASAMGMSEENHVDERSLWRTARSPLSSGGASVYM